MKFGPTSANHAAVAPCLVHQRRREGKAGRLHQRHANADKILKAPVTVIIGDGHSTSTQHLPCAVPARTGYARTWFGGLPEPVRRERSALPQFHRCRRPT
jgi:hypothetical protein